MVSRDGKGDIVDGADERIELVELLERKGGSFKSNGVVWLRLWALHRYAPSSAFVDAFDRMGQIRSTEDS